MRITSSPGSRRTEQALNRLCFAPELITICYGAARTLLSFQSFSETARRSSGMPGVGVYFVNPAWIAAIAASQIGSGVGKSGSPAASEITSIPSAFIAWARAEIPRVGEGFSWPARALRVREVTCLSIRHAEGSLER